MIPEYSFFWGAVLVSGCFVFFYFVWMCGNDFIGLHYEIIFTSTAAA